MGGSESRFIAKPLAGPDRYLMVETPHNYGQRVVLGARDENDRYQKFVLKTDDNSLNIRFDNHPQPYVCATKSRHNWIATMESWSGTSFTNEQYKWKMFVFAKRESKAGAKWYTQKEGYKIDWDNMKDHSIQAIFLNMETKMVLSHDSNGVCLDELKADDMEQVKKVAPKVVWEVECVDHNLSAGEVAAAVITPVVVTGGIVAGVIFAAGGAAAAGAGAGAALAAEADFATIIAVEIAEFAGIYEGPFAAGELAQVVETEAAIIARVVQAMG